MTRAVLHDPDALIRHRAIRVTLVMPAVFAFGVLVLDNPNVGLFAAFGAFSLLAFADFGGSTVVRTRAYLVLVAVGIVMIALGTLVSEHVVAGALTLAVIAFVITLGSVFGGSFVAGGPAALLLFVIAVMVPVPIAEVRGREVGFLLAGVASIAVASVLWPVHERRVIRLAAAEVADALAALLRRGGPPDAEEIAAIRGHLDDLRDRYGRAGIRPAGPTRRDQGLVRLIDQLQRATTFATRLEAIEPWPRLGPSAAAEPPDIEDPALAAAVADTFEHTALVLRGASPPDEAIDLEPVRVRHRVALEAWISTTLRVPGSSGLIAEQLARTFGMRVLSHTALSCDSDAILACGGRLSEDERGLLLDTPSGDDGITSTLARAGALLRPHLHPGSVTFRNALRAAVALSAALVVADLVHAEHGFWVVLGTLTVLKSSAMRTGITAFQALAGNVIGFVVAGLGMLAFGENPTVLWILLPITVFLAAYAPAAIHFVVGQASFTLLVVVLFNILEPEGWRTGLVRVESVALGVAVSLVVGVVFWPRGNRRALRAATANVYRAVAGYLDASFAALVHPAGDGRADPVAVPPAVVAARSRARDAELTADAALFDLLAAPGTASVPVAEWAHLTSVARSLRLVGDGVRAIPARGYQPLVDSAERDELDALARQRVAEVAAVADRIDDGRPGPATDGAAEPLVGWLARVDPTDDVAVDRILAMVWAVEWIGYIDTLTATDDDPIDVVSATVATPWWR